MHGAPIQTTAVFLPILVLMQTLFIMGLTFFISCMNVFFEDTKYILNALLNVLFYITPVMYVSELIFARLPLAHRGLYYKLYMLNPLNILTDAYRKILLPPFHGGLRGSNIQNQPLDYGMLGICAVVCIVIAIGGYAFFNARKWLFAERA